MVMNDRYLTTYKQLILMFVLVLNGCGTTQLYGRIKDMFWEARVVCPTDQKSAKQTVYPHFKYTADTALPCQYPLEVDGVMTIVLHQDGNDQKVWNYREPIFSAHPVLWRKFIMRDPVFFFVNRSNTVEKIERAVEPAPIGANVN
jgi:hypothetical protein